jgi:hypothetical protein
MKNELLHFVRTQKVFEGWSNQGKYERSSKNTL